MKKSTHQSPGSGTWQACTQCSASFEITKDDLAFYEKVSPEFGGKKYLVPPPTLCPDCRMQRRLSFRNEHSLHHRTCSKTGKSIVSMYAHDAAFPVFENEEWWKDDWDAQDFGLKVDPSVPFLMQLSDLFLRVPHMARVQQGENPNSQYTNCASHNKNCYLIFSSNLDENCLFGTWIISCIDTVDCLQCLRCELCYECTDCLDCYHCSYTRDSVSCTDSQFLQSCSGCTSCFGCFGLTHKQYCIFNEQCSKEEYEEKIAALDLNSFSSLQTALQICMEKGKNRGVRFYEGTQNENVSGNHITESKNAFECFDCNGLEDCKWCTNAQFFKDSYDVSYYGASENNELVYECEGVGHGTSRVLFSKLVWGNSSNVLLSYECFACEHCFGCIGLKHKKYCILNTQYTKDEYEALVPKIIERMRVGDGVAMNPSVASGSWGEFFPIALSPFGYNESVAQEYFPLEKSEVMSRDWNWRDDEQLKDQYLGPQYAIPDHLRDVPEEITKQILRCEVTGRHYKIIPQELKFYRQMGIPIPRKCPDQRHKERMALRNPRKLWRRECSTCHKQIRTSYSPERTETVYCEECYLKTVY